MIISIVFLIVFLFIFIFQYYFKEFIDVTVIYKSLRKVLESRDLLVLRILPDVKDKKISEEVLNLIQERKERNKVSYNEGIIADLKLHQSLKRLYEFINGMKKNEIQEELFKRIIHLEKRAKELRKKYSVAAEKYNLSLTLHPKLYIQLLHMKPLDIYGKKE